ncbi:hypothetical protein PROFUN_01699 [Planoprotostelium fungivorum]|uniref:Ankyrin repeat protein n=1 Tax=Planoprotostelium fungivorum TaxID=1890364 RepID=A0A2P6MWB9_9EUKA|nr:hypothetical protein PROFUN_01699 [Planoprotostelium fungivorum]
MSNFSNADKYLVIICCFLFFICFWITSTFLFWQGRQLMSNGIISSHDVTKLILDIVMGEYSTDATRRQFAILRLTCKLWKDIGETLYDKQALLMFSVDSFTDWMSNDDLISAQRQSTLQLCIRGHSETVRLLLSNPRVDPSAANNDAIRKAAKRGHTEILQLLLTDPRVVHQ